MTRSRYVADRLQHDGRRWSAIDPSDTTAARRAAEISTVADLLHNIAADLQHEAARLREAGPILVVEVMTEPPHIVCIMQTDGLPWAVVAPDGVGGFVRIPGPLWGLLAATDEPTPEPPPEPVSIADEARRALDRWVDAGAIDSYRFGPLDSVDIIRGGHAVGILLDAPTVRGWGGVGALIEAAIRKLRACAP